MQNNYLTVFVRHYLAFKTSRLKVTKPDIKAEKLSLLSQFRFSFCYGIPNSKLHSNSHSSLVNLTLAGLLVFSRSPVRGKNIFRRVCKNLIHVIGNSDRSKGVQRDLRMIKNNYLKVNCYIFPQKITFHVWNTMQDWMPCSETIYMRFPWHLVWQWLPALRFCMWKEQGTDTLILYEPQIFLLYMEDNRESHYIQTSSLSASFCSW